MVYYSGPFDIFVKLRELIAGTDKLNELFSCMFCLPTNIGIIMSILSLLFCQETPFTPFTILFDQNVNMWPLILIFDGFYTGAIVSIIATIFDKLSNNSATTITQEILND